MMHRNIGFLIFMFVAACGQNDQKAEQKTVETPAIASSKEDMAARGADTLPAYAPQYPGSEILASEKTKYDGFSQLAVEMKTTDPVQKVSDFYRANLKKHPSMPIEGDYSTPEKFSITAGDSPEYVETSITANAEDGTTKIYLNLNFSDE